MQTALMVKYGNKDQLASLNEKLEKGWKVIHSSGASQPIDGFSTPGWGEVVFLVILEDHK